MTIETERLILVPLTPGQLGLWVENIPALEENLRCSYKAEPMQGLFLEIVKKQLSAAEKDPEHYLYHSFWFLIRKEDRTVVGSADFKNVPDNNGEIEIGYGLGDRFEHKGYMTEAVHAMCEWALKQKNVTRITAETDIGSVASQHILQRCGFSIRTSGNTLWWELSGK
jgi:RimJ/RimL family protein N-acetyltransferase